MWISDFFARIFLVIVFVASYTSSGFSQNIGSELERIKSGFAELLSKNKPDEAYQFYRQNLNQLIENALTNKSEITDPLDYYALIVACETVERRDIADEFALALRRLAPDDVFAANYEIRAAINRGDVDAAVGLVKSRINTNPFRTTTLGLQGIVARMLVLNNRYEQAIEVLRECIEIHFELATTDTSRFQDLLELIPIFAECFYRSNKTQEWEESYLRYQNTLNELESPWIEVCNRNQVDSFQTQFTLGYYRLLISCYSPSSDPTQLAFDSLRQLENNFEKYLEFHMSAKLFERVLMLLIDASSQFSDPETISKQLGLLLERIESKTSLPNELKSQMIADCTRVRGHYEDLLLVRDTLSENPLFSQSTSGTPKIVVLIPSEKTGGDIYNNLKLLYSRFEGEEIVFVGSSQALDWFEESSFQKIVASEVFFREVLKVNGVAELIELSNRELVVIVSDSSSHGRKGFVGLSITKIHDIGKLLRISN